MPSVLYFLHARLNASALYFTPRTKWRRGAECECTQQCSLRCWNICRQHMCSLCSFGHRCVLNEGLRTFPLYTTLKYSFNHKRIFEFSFCSVPVSPSGLCFFGTIWMNSGFQFLQCRQNKGPTTSTLTRTSQTFSYLQPCCHFHIRLSHK